MAASMKAVTETGIELSNEERNLLSVAYKVSISKRYGEIFIQSYKLPSAWQGKPPSLLQLTILSERLILQLVAECGGGEAEFLAGDLQHRAEDRGGGA